MMKDHGRDGEARPTDQPQPRRRWQEMLSEFPSIRQVFHAVCALGQGEDATELLDFAGEAEGQTV